MSEIEDLIRELDGLDQIAGEDIDGVFATLSAHPKIHDFRIEHNPSRLVVTTEPILLQNPDGPETLNLGRLIIFINRDGSYGVTRDKTSDRDAGLTSDQVHPHVNHGGICQGDAKDMSLLAHEKHLAMLVSFIIEFLHFYNPSSTYWTAFFKHPCTECGKSRGSSPECKFCRCMSCSDRRSTDACHGCRHWKVQSASVARQWAKSFLDSQSEHMDEEQFIKKINELEVFFKGGQ